MEQLNREATVGDIPREVLVEVLRDERARMHITLLGRDCYDDKFYLCRKCFRGHWADSKVGMAHKSIYRMTSRMWKEQDARTE